MFMCIANVHLCTKNWKKLMMKSREIAKKQFSAIFPSFSTAKNFLPKIGLRHILGIAILHLFAKNQQKLMSQSREKLVTDGRTGAQTHGRTDNG